jgi:hypothetical protein
VEAPPFAEQPEHGFGNGDISVLAAFTAADVETAIGAIDVIDLHAKSLGKAQAAGIDEGEGGDEPGFADLTEEQADLLDTEDDRKSGAMADDELAEDAPRGIQAQEIAVEDPEADLGLVHGAGLVVFLLSEEEEVIADLLLGERSGIGPVVLGQEPDVGDVAVDGAGPQILKLDKAPVFG